MRWLYVIFVALACLASQATSQSSQAKASDSSQLPSETDDANDRSRRSLSDIAARRRSSLDKNFMSCGRACSPRPRRCSMPSCDEDLAAKRRSLLNKNFMRFGRSPSDALRFSRSPSNFMRFGRSSNFMRFGRAQTQETLDAMRTLRCADLLYALRNLQLNGRLKKRSAVMTSNADKYNDRRNDNFMRLGRAPKDADYETNAINDRKARDAQRRATEDEYKTEDNAKYLNDGFLRLGRDFEDDNNSAEDVFEIDLPDEKIY